MSVAIVHDYLNQRGGAERVVLELARIWPEAPICTSLYRRESTFPEFQSLDIRTSPLQHLPVDRSFRNLLPLYPLAFRSFGRLDQDLVISSSSGWAHSVRTGPGTFHVVYCHTPARWLYGSEYLRASPRQALLKPLSPALRAWDGRAAARPSLYVANSGAVRQRIWDAYGREAPIVHPPVDTERFTPSPRGERLLVLCRLLPYKRVDAIVAAASLAGIGLDVVGTGPAEQKLRSIAGPTVTFHGRLQDEELRQLMQSARAVCVPGEEDFGIVPVEAQAAGKPVVALGRGGALETVIDGVTGAFFYDHSPQSVLRAIERCEEIATPPAEIARHAQRFSKEAFRTKLLTTIAQASSARR